MSLQTDEAKATAAEIRDENVALEQADVAAEAQAEAVVEQAKQLTEMADNVLDELRDSNPEVG